MTSSKWLPVPGPVRRAGWPFSYGWQSGQTRLAISQGGRAQGGDVQFLFDNYKQTIYVTYLKLIDMKFGMINYKYATFGHRMSSEGFSIFN